jgi:heterodisulfide reductase subunit C
MLKQLFFSLVLIITLGIFAYTVYRFIFYFRLTKPFPIKDIGKRFLLMLKVAIFQSKILRKPVTGFLHALVFWGFCVIALGTIEMVIDGLFGTEKALSNTGVFYKVVSASGDIFGLLVLLSVTFFWFRRAFFHIKRFSGIEMKPRSHHDANFALSLIFLLMVTLLGMNICYLLSSPENIAGVYPVSAYFAGLMHGVNTDISHFFYEFYWWCHILLIFLFANILPYSKHFHVFMSIPNVFLSRLEPLGKLYNLESITNEVKFMLGLTTETLTNPEQAIRFGVKDVDDLTWKNYLDSLSCTQCGRCTAVCPANITGKMLSPRKIVMNVRQRMKEKGSYMFKNGIDQSDDKSLLNDYISWEELWACTTCNACATECPININHPSIIIDMRRYLVMEEAKVPSPLIPVFQTIENNGAPWQYSPEDRLKWTENL